MLTVLQEKIAEAHGLALAAGVVTAEVEQRVHERARRLELWAMQDDAEETRVRCLEVEQSLGEELAAEMLAHAQATKEKAADLVHAWFKAGTGPLAAWSFLAMAEAGEVAAWTSLAELAGRALDERVGELAAWALPIQRRHLATALDGVAALARAAVPAAPRWG